MSAEGPLARSGAPLVQPDSGHAGACTHSVQFYEQDDFLLDQVNRLIGGALEAGDAAVVIATEPHRDGIAQRLRDRGLDVTALGEQGRYHALDAGQTLSDFMVDGWPDERRFADVVGGTIARAAASDHGAAVRAFGEMVLLLWAQGHREAAIRLEELWNDLARTHAFSLVCGYSMDVFGGEAAGTSFGRVCAEHSHVIPAESYVALASPDERNRAIAHLQQKAQALDELLVVAERAREDAENANRAKDEFLAMLGHELRNPLSAVRNALVTARLDPARRERALRHRLPPGRPAGAAGRRPARRGAHHAGQDHLAHAAGLLRDPRRARARNGATVDRGARAPPAR